MVGFGGGAFAAQFSVFHFFIRIGVCGDAQNSFPVILFFLYQRRRKSHQSSFFTRSNSLNKRRVPRLDADRLPNYNGEDPRRRKKHIQNRGILDSKEGKT